MAKYEEMIRRLERKHGDRFSDRDLLPKFRPYYESGARIRVRKHGEERTGTIGVTTGHVPAFLLLFRSNSHGSWYLLDARDEIVAVKRGRSYVAV